VEELAAYERRFRRAGLPLFIEDYTASEDVFNRAAPLLALVFIIEMLGAIDLDWSLWANLGAAFGGLAILLVAFGIVNRLRGRSVWAVPDRVGPPELAAFVLIPAALPLIFGGQLTSAVVTALGNLVLLALVLGVVGFGLLSIVRWAGTRLVGQLAASLSLLARAVPLLLLFALVLFINTEMWQVFSSMPDAFLVTAALLVAGLGLSFLIFRLPRELGELEREAVGAGPPLARRERVNVGLVMLVSQALQVLVVSLAVGGFFVVFGALAVGPEVRDSWIGSNGTVLIDVPFFGERAQITEELLRVSGGIAAFSGLYYAIAVLTDSTYREEFLEELSDEMRSTFHARGEYLARLEPRADEV
jgi:hypothetical protein